MSGRDVATCRVRALLHMQPTPKTPTYDRGEPTASVLSADGFPLMAGPNFQLSDGNPIVISILRQLADGPEYVPEI